MKLYMGKIFRGNKIVSAMVLRDVVMGKLSNGRHFIVAARDLDKVTFAQTVKVRDMLKAA
jgi:hypothetical protein